MIELKKNIIARSLRNIYIKNKVIGWTNLKYNMLAERQKKRITSINTLMKGIQKRNIVYAWLRLNFYKVK